MASASIAVALLGGGCEPDGPAALRRGAGLILAGKPAEAAPLLERAVAALPHAAPAWNELGLAWHALGRTPEAEQAYLRALREDPNFFDAYFNLGSLAAESGRWPEAERHWRAFIAAEPSKANGTVWRLLGQAEWRNHSSGSDRSLSMAARLDPNNAEVWNALGLVLIDQRRYRDAQKDFAYAAQLAPRDPSPRLNLAVNAQTHLGDTPTAIRCYEDYLSLAPSSPKAALVRAWIERLRAAPVTPTAANPPPPATNAPAAHDHTAPATALATIPQPQERPAAISRAGPPTNSIVAAPVRPHPATPDPSSRPPLDRLPSRPSNVIATVAPQSETTRRHEPSTLELVPVQEEPAPQPARDAPTAVALSAPPQNPAPSIASVAASNRPAGSGSPAKGSVDRPRFWSRVNPTKWKNPIRWFGGSSTNEVLPPPPDRTKPPLARAAPRPDIPRYNQQWKQPPAPGDRPQAEALTGDASAALDRRDRDAAADLLSQAVLADPSFFDAQFNLAVVTLESGNKNQALKAAEAATQIDPQSASARRLFANALQRFGYPADAADQLELALASEPNSAQTHLRLGSLYARNLDDPDRARSHYERALALDPSLPQARAVRAWLEENH